MPGFLNRTLANNIWKMQAIRLLFWTHFIASVLVPFFQQWGGLDLTRILLLNAWFMLWNFLLEIPTGTVADFLSRRASVALGCGVAALGAVVYVSTPHYGVFLFAEIFFAAAHTLLSGADEALTYDTLKELDQVERAKRTLASLESFKLAGIIVGALSGSFIATAWGIEKPLLLQSVPALIACFLAFSLVEPGVAREGRERERYGQILLSGVRYFLRHKILQVLTTDMVVITTLTWLVIWLYQPFLARAGVDLVYFGLVHAGMCLGQIAVLSQIERLDRLFGSPRRFLVGSASLVGLAFLTLAATTSIPWVILAILVAASFGLCRPVLFAAYLNRHIPSERRATVLSTISMFRTLAVAVINPFAGLLADRSLSLIVLVLGLAILILSWTSRLEERHLAEVES